MLFAYGERCPQGERAMMLGLYTPLPHINRPEPDIGMAGRWDEGVRLAFEHVSLADRAGFGITLVAQRYLGPDLEAWTLASALSQVTRHIRLMPAFHPTFWGPQQFAKMCATLDRVSGGRLALNLVTGWWREEHAMYGGMLLDEEPRYARAEEFVAVLRRLWTEESVTFRGSQLSLDQVELVLKPLQSSPPIYGASRSERGLDMIARACDAWFVPYPNDFRTAAQNVAGMQSHMERMTERAARFGRAKLSYAANALVIYEHDENLAKRLAEDVERHGSSGGQVNQIHTYGLGAGLIGGKNQILDAIARLDQIGIDMLLLKFYPAERGLKRFVDDLAPLVIGEQAAVVGGARV
jgi:FMNH2-dependent dimethyl sulfone monooxygenase